MPERRATWEGLAEWWLAELEEDPAYEQEVAPLIVDLLAPEPGWRVLDVGCGEGRLMHRLSQLGVDPVGVDIEPGLLRMAVMSGPVLRASLPDLGAVRDSAFDAAAVSLVLEHLDDEISFFSEIARIVKAGGVLALVVNHPIFTAPDSAPIQEIDEVLWRPGTYFDPGFTDEPIGGRSVRFHHRPLGRLLTVASDAGWDLKRMIEGGVSDEQVRRHPPLDDQRHIPRILGVRWRRRR